MAQDIFDTIDAPAGADTGGDIFDQLSKKKAQPSSLAPVQPGADPFQSPSAHQPQPPQEHAQLPDSFQQQLAEKGDQMRQQQPDQNILGALGEVASIPFKALGAVGADVLNRGRSELQAEDGMPAWQREIYAPRLGESDESRKERLAFRSEKPLYEPQGTALAPNGNDLQRIISQWSSPEALSMFAASEIPLGRLAMGVQMAAGAPQQLHSILSPDSTLTDEQKRDQVNNLFAMGLLMAKGGAYPHEAPAGAKPASPSYLGRTVQENVASMLGSRAEPPPITPELRESRKTQLQAIAKEAGADLSFVPDAITPDRPRDVAHTMPDGRVVVSEKNFHERLEQELSSGVSMDEAIGNVLNEELIHSKFKQLEGGDDIAEGLWKNMSGVEQALFKRKLHGAGYEGRPYTDLQYGHEALRFAFQRLQKIRPGEHIFGTDKEVGTSKILTALEDAIRWVREKIGRTDASKRQRGYLDQLKENINILKKGSPDARSVASPESPAQPEVRPQVGQEAPLRQQGEAAPAQEPVAPVAEEAPISLTPEQEQEAKDWMAQGSTREEAVDLVTSKAPPAASTGEAQPEQAPTVSEAPPAVAPAEGPAATPSISQSFPESKVQELDALSAKIRGKGYEINEQEYKRYQQLSRELEEAERTAGGGDQPSEPLAMSRKQGADRSEEVKAMSSDELVKAFPRGMNPENWSIGETAGPEEVSRMKEHLADVDSKLADLKKELSTGKATMDQMKEFQTLTMKRQYFSEAVQAAPKESGGEGRVFRGAEERANARNDELAKSLGLTFRGTMKTPTREVDQYLYDQPGPNGEPSGITVSVPHGTSAEGVQAKMNERLAQYGVEPLAMSRKSTTPMDKETELVNKVIQIVGGYDTPEKDAIIRDVSKQILTAPQEHWGAMLTQFHQDYKAQEIAEAQKNINQDTAPLSTADEQLMQKVKSGEDLSPEDLKLFSEIEARTAAFDAMFSSVDRQGVYRDAIKELNQPITPVAAPASSGKLKVLPDSGRPENLAVRPTYNAPDYGKWWSKFHRDFPHIPENLAREVWADAANDVLNNASGERVKELLRAARMEKRFLGEQLLRTIPDADPYPIFEDIAKSPSPKDSVKFRKFCQVRDLTPDQGVEILNQMLAHYQEQMKGGKENLGGTAKTVKTAEGQEVLEAGREALGQGAKADLEQEWKKGIALNQKRGNAARSALAEWLIGQAKPPERDPMRRSIGIEDIWWTSKDQRGPYASYGTQQGENASFLRSKLVGRGASVKGESASKLSRSVVVVVDRDTGDYHAVSAYVRQGQPMIYNPDAPVGSKEGNFITLPALLAKYRVAASMMVKDPLYRLHQAWLTEKGGRTGEQKYEQEIGAVSTLKENSAQEQYQSYLQEREAERTEAEREQFEQRFAEEEPAPGEEAPLPIKKQSEQRRSSEHLAALTEASDPDAPTRKRPIPVESQIAIEAWMKGGVGRGPLGLFETDLRSLAEHSLTGREVESVYGLLSELDIKSGYDFEKLLQKVELALGIERPEEQRAGLADVLKQKRAPLTLQTRLSGSDISALYGISKIIKRTQNEMMKSAYEQRRLAPLKKAAMEGKDAKADPLPDSDYSEMNEAERAYADALEALKYRAVLNTFDRLYEIANEARGAKAEPAQGAGGELATPPDVAAFRAATLNRYGDPTRRGVEQAALSARQAPEISGERTLLAGSKFGGTPRTLIERRLASGPTAELPAGMLPPGAARYEPAPPPVGAFPTIPTTPSNIGGSKFTGLPPATIPERGTPVPFGAAEKGFVPSGPTRHELLTGQAKPERNLLREPGTEQLMMRKIAEQSRGFPPDDPLAMTRKGYGPSQDMADEARSARGLPGIKRDQQAAVPKQEYIARGRDLISSGKINPEKEMARYEAAQAMEKGSGYLSENSALAFRYWGYHLQEMAYSAIEKNPKSKQADFAQKLSDSWQKRMEAASGEMFARLGHGLQGWNQIGPDDMQSTTFVRRFLKKAGAKLEGVDEDDYEIPQDQLDHAARIARGIKAAQDGLGNIYEDMSDEASKGTDPDMDEGNKAASAGFKKFSQDQKNASMEALKAKRPKGSAMAMKGESGELPPMSPEDETLMGNVGADVMRELSEKNDLTDARFIEEMKKELALGGREDMEPYLGHIRAVSEEILDTGINNKIGTGDATKDAREIFKRKRPPIEESIEAIHRAMEADPSGKRMTPAESYHVWNYLKTRFLDRNSPTHTLDFKEIRTKASAELGIKDSKGNIVEGKEYDQLRLFRAMSSNRTMRRLTEEVIKRMRDEARVKDAAYNWLKNQQYPGWLRVARMFPRLFFFDKIIGHGLVPMITHAPTLMFNPQAWSVYFGSPGKTGAWAEMYRMTGLPTDKGQFNARLYHESRMAEMTGHENFERWKTAKLQCDPFKHTDDYQIEALHKVLGEKFSWLTEGRGFDALKTLRYAMAEKWLNSLPEHLQNDRSMSLIADSVNHATGIVKSQFHEALNWAMFAPKLEASRWAYMFKDTVKAANYIANWKTASLEQRAWAIREMKQKAMVVGVYAGALAMNQAFLSMTGSDQKINYSDPKKPDFLSFKVHGFKVGVASPFIGVMRLFANAYHAAVGERTKYEKLTSRQKELMTVAGKYARGKASPFASFGIDLASQEDYSGRKLPWSSEPLTRSQRLKGETPYSAGEYIAQTFTPIPIEEMVKETWGQMGMTPEEIGKLTRALLIGATMSATGARVSEDVQ